MFKSMGFEDFLIHLRGFVINVSNKCTIYVSNNLLIFIVHLLEKNSKILKYARYIYQDTPGVI